MMYKRIISKLFNMSHRQEKIIHILIADTKSGKEIGEFPVILASESKEISKNLMKKILDDKSLKHDSFSIDSSVIDSERHINENLISNHDDPVINTYEHSSFVKCYYLNDDINNRILLIQTNSLRCTKDHASKFLKELLDTKLRNEDSYEEIVKLDSYNELKKNEVDSVPQYTKTLMYLYSKYNRNTDSIFKKDRIEIEKTNSWRKFKIGFIIIIMLIALALVILIPIVMILSKNYNSKSGISKEFELNND